MLIPLVSTVVAITLLPVVLAKVGARLDWPHRRTDDKASRAWTRWATAVARRRWLATGAGMAVVVALAFAATDLQLGNADADTIARSGDANGLAAGILLDATVIRALIVPAVIALMARRAAAAPARRTDDRGPPARSHGISRGATAHWRGG